MRPTRSRVLVVEDEATVREVLREGLDVQGYDVEVAETAVGALAAARERRPDVVLLDLYMPGALSGEQALEALSAFAPVIVVTASADEELGRRLLSDGAFDFVMKPFNFARITELVEAAIAARSLDMSAAAPRIEPVVPGASWWSAIRRPGHRSWNVPGASFSRNAETAACVSLAPEQPSPR